MSTRHIHPYLPACWIRFRAVCLAFVRRVLSIPIRPIHIIWSVEACFLEATEDLGWGERALPDHFEVQVDSRTRHRLRSLESRILRRIQVQVARLAERQGWPEPHFAALAFRCVDDHSSDHFLKVCATIGPRPTSFDPGDAFTDESPIEVATTTSQPIVEQIAAPSRLLTRICHVTFVVRAPLDKRGVPIGVSRPETTIGGPGSDFAFEAVDSGEGITVKRGVSGEIRLTRAGKEPIFVNGFQVLEDEVAVVPRDRVALQGLELEVVSCRREPKPASLGEA